MNEIDLLSVSLVLEENVPYQSSRQRYVVNHWRISFEMVVENEPAEVNDWVIPFEILQNTY